MRTVQKLTAAFVSGALSLPLLARAEPPPAPTVEYGFEEELVKGDLIRPDVEVLRTRRIGGRASLVEVRSSYLPELLKSVEDL
jgi:hypothetical protein